MFVEYLRSIGKVNKICTSSNVDIDNVKSVLEEFRTKFTQLQEGFNLSQTLKIHIIMDHLEDYFKLSGQSLLRSSDELVEATHSKLGKFEQTHNYKRNNIGSPATLNHNTIQQFTSIV